ncbi:MAG: Uma2 family endonuclease, partial [Chloroflexota bacterium]|nr:Uma2 family endonuclease [Chloroflexota bacterium]
SVMRAFVEQHDLGVVLSAPFQMKLARSGREPDLLFVAQEHLGRLQETYLDGPADLAVEIISLESIGRDRGDKFCEYEEAGIPEYWLIDPLREQAEFYRLDAQGRYCLTSPDEEGVYHSQTLPGFWLRVDWLWQESLPHSVRALGEIAGLDREMVERFLQALGGRK